jgi:hypothetical protein
VSLLKDDLLNKDNINNSVNITIDTTTADPTESNISESKDRYKSEERNSGTIS